MKKTLFLDFDGVLHGEGKNSNGKFEHMEKFCHTVRPFVNNLQIVISSSWRETHSLESLKSFFEKDIGDIIVGVTPLFIDRFDSGGREKEILEYCRINSIDTNNWVALDDMEILFSNNCKNVILVDNEYGLLDGDIKMLKYFLTKN